MNSRNTAPIVLAFLSIAFGKSSQPQQHYELVLPGTEILSQAVRTDVSLRITDSSGGETHYERAARYDSADGFFLGYHSAAARQAIRWPANDQGSMQIAATASGGDPIFRPSRMEIRTRVRTDGPLSVSDIDPLAAHRLTTASAKDQNLATAVAADGSIALRRAQQEDAQHWHLRPMGHGVFRIHSDAMGRQWSLAAVAGGGVQMEKTANAIHQLWQFNEVGGQPGSFVFVNASAVFSGHVLTCGPGVPFGLRPRRLGPHQVWHLLPVGGRLPAVFAQYQFVSREIRPQAALEPANVEFVNNHQKELWVLVADQRDPTRSLWVKIPAGKSRTLPLERDAGGTLVEVYERVLSNGVVKRDELVTPLPPLPRYDVSVYERIVQSVAIDGTVPGGKLEDVQYAPRSVGWFALAPGIELKDGPLDVHEIAKAQENAGQVRRIDPADWKPAGAAQDRVEALLEKFQPQKR